MASQQKHETAVNHTATTYRITPGGRAVAAWEKQGGRTRHLLDLLHLLHNSGHGIAEAHLRQFMPLESLLRSISCLTALGLIEPQDHPRVPEHTLQQHAGGGGAAGSHAQPR